MLQNASDTVFTVSELLRENQQGGGGGNVSVEWNFQLVKYYSLKFI